MDVKKKSKSTKSTKNVQRVLSEAEIAEKAYEEKQLRKEAKKKAKVESDNQKIIKGLETANKLLQEGKVTSSLRRKLLKLSEKTEETLGLDHELIFALKDYFGDEYSEHAIDKADYKYILDKIGESDLVIYFKDADLIGKFNKSAIESLCLQYEGFKTYNSKNPRCEGLKEKLKLEKNAYEVVKNDKPQKIIIINSGNISSNTKKIQKYILKYMQSHDIDINKEDVKCLKNKSNGNVEFLITKYFVNNLNEKEQFVKGLKKYIESKSGDDEMINLIGKEESSSHRIQNTKSIAMPFQKEFINGTQINHQHVQEFTELLVSQIQDCQALKIGESDGAININIMINNGNINNNVISGNNNTIVSSTGDIYDQLYNKLLIDKPEWYKPKRFVKKNEVYEHFKSMCSDDENINQIQFWKKMKPKIVSNEKNIQSSGKRTQNITLKKLW